MKITILLDHDLEGQDVFLEAGFRETGWAQVLEITFSRLRDFELPDDCTDQAIWHFVQQQRLLLITSNRNNDSESSLEAAIRRETAPDSLPVITISDKDHLVTADYRQRVADSLATIIIYLDNYLGSGRLYVP